MRLSSPMLCSSYVSHHQKGADEIREKPSPQTSGMNRMSQFPPEAASYPVLVRHDDWRADESSLSLVASASRLLVLGTSLATYSAFRLVKQAVEHAKPILMISTGPSRADGMKGLEKMDREAGPILREYLNELLRCVVVAWI